MTRENYKHAKIKACEKIITEQSVYLRTEDAATHRNKKKNAERLIARAQQNLDHIVSGEWNQMDEYYFVQLYERQSADTPVSAF